MVVLQLQLLAIIACSSALLLRPVDEICRCQDATMNCICDSRQDITFRDVKNCDFKHVVVRGCGRVTFLNRTLQNLKLETIELSDIVHLNICKYALSGISSLSHLSISNVTDFNVESYGLSGLHNVSSITLSNVTAEVFAGTSFEQMSGIADFSIENCTFQTVKLGALYISNGTSFRVTNSNFRTVEPTAIRINNSKEVSFQNVYFGEAIGYSFLIYHVDKLYFTNCIFGSLAYDAFRTMSLQSFSLKNCTIEVQHGALLLLAYSDNLYFTDNIIKKTNMKSLLPKYRLLIPESMNLVVSGNSLTCDCNISWIWDSSHANKSQVPSSLYEEFREKNFCIGGVNETMSSFTPVLDGSFRCKTIVKNTQSTDLAVPMEKEMSSSQANCNNFHVHFLAILALFFYALPRNALLYFY